MKDNIKEYKLKNGKKRYMFNVYLGRNPVLEKDDIVTRRGFKSKEEARKMLNQIRYEYDNNVWKKKERETVTYKEAFDRYVNLYKSTVKESTFNKYLQIMNNHVLPVFAHKKLSNITVEDCERFAHELSDTLKNFNVAYSYASAVFKFSIKRKLISRNNPFDDCILPRVRYERKEWNMYEKHELIEFLECVRNKGDLLWTTFFHVVAYTGMRRGEILALTWSDVNFEKYNITINKTLTIGANNQQYIETAKTVKSNRVIGLDKSTVAVLRGWKEFQEKSQVLNNYDLVFPNSRGNHFALPKPAKVMKSIMVANNLRYVNLHSFRHTHASLLFEAGASIKEVQQRLGHATVNTTMNVYVHVTKDESKKTADKFAKILEN